jgi:hypothetical protein
VQDVETFRQTGLHVTNPQGSLIPWQDLQVNWNLFGASDLSLSPEQVVQNFINQIEAGDPECG